MKYGSISFARILEMNVRASMLFILVWMVCFLAPASADERILDFHSDIRIEQNGDLVVTETIKVRSEGDRIKRGIYRDFPRVIKLRDNRFARVGFEVLSVKRDGVVEAWHQTEVGDFSRVYIGKSNRFIASGIHTFELAYRTNRQLRFFETHDELFWNVTGTKWAFPIDHASAMITLPDQIKAYETIFFTGPLGSKQKFANAELLEDGKRISFETTRPLGLHENLTIGIKVPRGSFPNRFDVAPPPPEGFKGEIILGGGLVALMLFYLTSWWLVGRDPPKGVIVPRWDVSDEVSPALVYYVQNKGINKNPARAMSAAIISLAVKGYLTLDSLGRNPMLRRTDTPTIAEIRSKNLLPVGELAIIDALEQRPERSIYLYKGTGPSQKKILQQFKTALEKEHRSKYFRNNIKLVLGGIVFSIICMIATLANGGVSDQTFSLIVPAAAFGIFGTLYSARLIRNYSTSTTLWSKIATVTKWVALLVPVMVIFALYMLSFTIRMDQPILLGIMVLTLAVHGLFYFLMGAPTPLGRETMDFIAGLKTYISLAEQGRFNQKDIPDLTTSHFEQMLPYAIALNVEKPWTNYLGQVLEHADQDGKPEYESSWFDGAIEVRRLPNTFNDLSSNLQQSMSFTSAAPRPSHASSAVDASSSGFSGGGYSGGGYGGGGGDGW